MFVGVSGERRCESASWFPSEAGIVRRKDLDRYRRCGVAHAESAAWKSRVLPASDDRQEEASGRTSGALGERTAANPTRGWWYIPSFPADGRWRPVPWAKRCNRLPLLESGANLSALSSARSSANLAPPRCPRPRWSIDLKIDPINDRSKCKSRSQKRGSKENLRRSLEHDEGELRDSVYLADVSYVRSECWIPQRSLMWTPRWLRSRVWSFQDFARVGILHAPWRVPAHIPPLLKDLASWNRASFGANTTLN